VSYGDIDGTSKDPQVLYYAFTGASAYTADMAHGKRRATFDTCTADNALCRAAFQPIHE